jgi:hypothetical protein
LAGRALVSVEAGVDPALASVHESSTRGLFSCLSHMHFERRTAFRFQQSQQLLHVFGAGAEVHWIDPEPSLAFQFGRRNTELSALLNPSTTCACSLFESASFKSP